MDSTYTIQKGKIFSFLVGTMQSTFSFFCIQVVILLPKSILTVMYVSIYYLHGGGSGS